MSPFSCTTSLQLDARLWRWGAAWALAAALVTCCPKSFASDSAAAQALFEAGAAARDSGDYAQACEKFEASNDLEPAAGTVLNIADCKEQQGLLAQAWQRYAEAAEKLKSSDPRAQYARQKANELRGRLPRLTLTWPPDSREGLIYLDGKVLPESVVGVPLPIDPGAHRLTVRAEGRDDWSLQLTMEEGGSQAVELRVGPESTTASTTETAAPGDDEFEDREPRSISALRMAGWVSLGVGVAGIATGSVTGLIALDDAKTVDEDCEDDFCRSNAGKTAADRGSRMSTVSTISFIAGGVLTATGVTLLVLPQQRQQREKSAAREFRLLPRWGGAQLSWRQTF